MVDAMSKSMIPEGLVRLTHAFVEDVSSRSWFFSLAESSAVMRHSALREMAEQMRRERADPELALAVAALTHPQMFDAVQKAVRERCDI